MQKLLRPLKLSAINAINLYMKIRNRKMTFISNALQQMKYVKIKFNKSSCLSSYDNEIVQINTLMVYCQ